MEQYGFPGVCLKGTAHRGTMEVHPGVMEARPAAVEASAEERGGSPCTMKIHHLAGVPHPTVL
jgi:hypothetical protein